MLKLLKYLKVYSLYILAIVGLLFIQATSDLSLPDYMSNIVNVGIQQGGIENSVPKVIRESEYQKLKMLLSSDENSAFIDNYKLLSKETLDSKDYETYIKKYPKLEDESIYLINTSDKTVLSYINKALERKLLILYGIEKGNFGGEGMPSNLPKEQIQMMLESIEDKINEMPENMLQQSSALYIKEEYEKIGLNTQGLQNKYILKVGAFMLSISLISMIATVLVGFLSARVAAGLGRMLRKKVFEKITTFSSTEFDSFSTASLITRSTNDIQQIQILMVMLFRIVFYAPILGVGGIIKALSTNTSMGWIIAVGVMAILTLVIVLSSIALPKFKAVQKLVDRVNLIIKESLSGMLVIRAFNTEKFQQNKFEKANKDLTSTNLFINRLMTLMMPTMMLIMNGLMLLIIWVGAHQIDMGTIQVGDMMAFMQYTMQIIMSFLMISMVSIMLPRASVSAQRISEVIERDLVIKDPEKTIPFNDDKKGLVEFKDVCFKYPGAEECVISHINFTANPGETTAIIGSTGCGKSTLINLIPRFYDVTEGEILIDGVNIKQVNQSDLRNKIGFTPQKGVLFSGTIESNIKYGETEVTDESMKKAIRIAQAEEFIEEKEEAYEFVISQGGTNVSGGQKQRLSIARALAKDPDIFIFDDTFSALDFKTDKALRKALREETIDKTVIIVAQRISTIRYAEKIIVMNEGVIVGEGTHKELLETCEVYKEIAYSQLSKEELS